MAKDKDRPRDADKIPTPEEALKLAGLDSAADEAADAVEAVAKAGSAVSALVADSALKIEPLKILTEKFKAAKRDRYWIGTLPGCCQYNVVLGSPVVGVMFHQTTEDVVTRADPIETVRIPRKGQLYDLSQDEVDAILADVKLKVIRPSSSKENQDGGRRGFILRTNDGQYKPHEGDVPLACFVYIIPVVGNMPDGYRENYPPPLLARPS
jgi:hypothetical protein